MLKHLEIEWRAPDRQKLFLLLLAFIYIFDEQIGLRVNTYILGSLLYVLATFLFSPHIIFAGRAISLKLGALLIALSTYSLLAYLSSLGCSVEVKGAVSMVLLWLVVLVIPISRLAGIVTTRSVSNVVLILVLTAICLDALDIHLFASIILNDGRNSGFFLEPSHLAMFVIPFIAYRLLVSSRDWLSWIVIIVVMLFSHSSTFLVDLVGVFMLWVIRGRYLFHSAGLIRIVLIVVFVAIAAGLLDVSNTQERINGILEGLQGSEISNLSSIVWLNGWSQAYEYFVATLGLGVGFNQMGCGEFVKLGRYSSDMFDIRGGVLNLQDGSFMAAKLISELGVVGLLLVIFLAGLSIKSIVNINTNYAGGGNNSIALARAVGGICLLSLLFVRCAGYFQLQVILTISLLVMKLPNRTFAKL
jgi:hypothetical protein